MKLIALALLTVLTASFAHASPETPIHSRVDWITPTNYSIDGRKVVVTAEGHEFVQIAPQDAGLTAQEILQKYRQAMHMMITDQGDVPYWAQEFNRRNLSGVYTNQGMYNGPRYGFVGFRFPDFHGQDALIFRYTPAERKANLDNNVSRPKNFSRIENRQNQGLLLTGGCKQYVGPTNDHMQDGSSKAECYGQVELYIRIDKRN